MVYPLDVLVHNCTNKITFQMTISIVILRLNCGDWPYAWCNVSNNMTCFTPFFFQYSICYFLNLHQFFLFLFLTTGTLRSNINHNPTSSSLGVICFLLNISLHRVDMCFMFPKCICGIELLLGFDLKRFKLVHYHKLFSFLS